MIEFVWVSVQTWKGLLGLEIVVGLLRDLVESWIGIAVGAPEGGLGIIR